MNTKRKQTKARDLETEREELLATMAEYVSPDTKAKIDAAVKAANKLEEFKVIVSHQGAADADNK